MATNDFPEQPSFRNHEQTAEGLSLGNTGQTGHPHRPRRQTARRETRPQRSVPVRIGPTFQEMLSRTGPVLMV
jgi:hypothetical protein